MKRGEAELKLGLLSSASPGNQPSYRDPSSSDKSLTEQQCDKSKWAAQQNFTCWSFERELKQTQYGLILLFCLQGMGEHELQVANKQKPGSGLMLQSHPWVLAQGPKAAITSEHLGQHSVSHTAYLSLKGS